MTNIIPNHQMVWVPTLPIKVLFDATAIRCILSCKKKITLKDTAIEKSHLVYCNRLHLINPLHSK